MIMREALYRGKSVDRNKWVYGDLFHTEKDFKKVVEIIDFNEKPYAHIVKSNTVGQYIGIKDKNGTRIFEGDILKIAIIKDSEDDIEYKFGSVEFSTRSLEYIIRSKEGLVCGFGVILNGAGFYEFELEVIGNIYDNKSLLE